jgi:biopolymer transport protein ExbD
MQAHLSSGANASPNLTPLLDLVLQLIMFFMITIDLVQRDRMNPEVDLPVSQKAMPLDRGPANYLFLNINREGKLLGAAEGMDAPSKLKVFLYREKDRLEHDARAEGVKGEIPIIVVVRPDKGVAYRHVFRLVRLCSDAGLTRWQWRVRSKG